MCWATLESPCLCLWWGSHLLNLLVLFSCISISFRSCVKWHASYLWVTQNQWITCKYCACTCQGNIELYCNTPHRIAVYSVKIQSNHSQAYLNYRTGTFNKYYITKDHRAIHLILCDRACENWPCEHKKLPIFSVFFVS